MTDSKTSAGQFSPASKFPKVAGLACLIAIVPGVEAGASSYTTLSLPSQSESVTAIGAAPDKDELNLNLGDLRTRDAKLPGGSTTLRQRMAMRARLRERRVNDVTQATRGGGETQFGTATPASGEAQIDGEILLPPGEGGSDVQLSAAPKDSSRTVEPGRFGSDF